MSEEAEALADMHVGAEVAYHDRLYNSDNYRPYTTSQRRRYVSNKLNSFRKSQIGKYVIIQDPRYKKSTVELLYLVDRSRFKSMWWTPDAFFAMIFKSKDAALAQVAKIRFNNPRVIEITESMTRMS